MDIDKDLIKDKHYEINLACAVSFNVSNEIESIL